MSEYYDVCIVGGGVIGCMVARELARYKLDVLVLERANDVGKGSSKANSGLIHTGFHARGGSLKGTSTVEGNALYTVLAHELEVPFKRVGGLYCAFGPNGQEKIREKRQRAYENGAGWLPLLSGNEAREFEPRLSHDVIEAMWAESTGIISPFALVVACAENAAQNGVQFRFNAKVEHIERDERWWDDGRGGGCWGSWRLWLEDESCVQAPFVVNAAGDMAALLDAQVHQADLIVQPKRGQFYVFDKQGGPDAPLPIRHVLFQAQENDEGGTLLAPTIDDNIIAGPTSEDVRYFHQNATTAEGLAHVQWVAEKIVPGIDLRRVITEFAGVRANISNVVKEKKDFVVRASAPGFVSTLGIKNPGMTCAPALAKMAVRILAQEGLPLEADPDFDPRRKQRVPFLESDGEEQKRLLAQDERFGHVLCRCEKITEGDVRRELGGVLPPVDFEGVKHRLRTGMGRCQGGFCKPRVQAILDERAASENAVAYRSTLREPAEGISAASVCESGVEARPTWSQVTSRASRELAPTEPEVLPARLRVTSASGDAWVACSQSVDVLVIGGGAAGLAAASAAAHAGADVLLVEREEYLGGVLPQCIHDGFGLYVYKENLTGPQYAERWLTQLASAGVAWSTSTNVTELSHDGAFFTARVVGVPLGGVRTVRAKSVVIASGCREVTRGQLRIPGTRPEGIYTAGTAQYMVNIQHKLPGDKVVILGGGDIGLIMARRMTLSGAQVRMLVAKEATGLVRNHRRCIDPYDIPTRYGWGVASIHGYGRLKGVMVAPFADDGGFDMSRKEYVRCNTLLISCGLVPERELFAGVEGAPGLFICGNAESVHDLVDRVSVEGLRVGVQAAGFAGCNAVLPHELETIQQLDIAQLPVGEHVGWVR